ncbi:MAG TPA: enoyl-CoA hydratase/isomerase family protein [Jiangellaceae bacterium]|nr:enoyl-CoA hydratase/isomerase family protein [Jiangellaceae bacterium]
MSTQPALTALDDALAAGGEVVFGRLGRLGRIRLNRPEVINALTTAMVVAIREKLEAWAHDDAITSVLIDGAGARGLCAGGDVRALRTSLRQGTGAADEFWTQEYRLNAAIAHYPKPFVAVMDGIVMGGGVGVSAHGRVRLATERSRIAMPETAIGFFPDVGSLYLLSRAPGELGTHLALTGASIGGTDALACGLADAVIDSERIDDVVLQLAAGESLTLPDGAGTGELASHRGWIDPCYAGDDPAAILQSLRAHPATAARAAADVLSTRSPLAVAVTLEAIRRARTMASIDEVLRQDRVVAHAFAAEPDFVEGVRAVLVDRDHAPQWSHRSLTDVPRVKVLRMFDDRR